MTLDLPTFLRLVWQTVIAPAETAERIVALRLPRAVLWQAMALVTILSVLLAALVQGALPTLPTATGTPIAPISYALILGGSLVILVFALHYTGQALGGNGEFSGAIALVVWLEAVAMVIRFAQGILLLISPAIAGLFSIVSLGILLWCLINFIDVLHRFDSRGKAVLVLFLAVVGIAVGLTFILALIGAGATGGSN